MAKFSVIVPVYGTEKYLEACIQSLQRQTYRDYEVILVDDRSPDHCPELCDTYAKKDRSIYVIHKERNEGLAEARNTGMKAAKGDYILFVDSDDTVSPDLLLQCAKKAHQSTDILSFGMSFQYEDRKGKMIREEVHRAGKEIFAVGSKLQVFNELCRCGLFSYACNKAYRSEFVKEQSLQFEKVDCIEDFVFNIRAFEAVAETCILDDVLYYYRKPHHETLASRYHVDFFRLSLQKFRMEYEFAMRNSSDSQWMMALTLIQKSLVRHFLSAVIRTFSPESSLDFCGKFKEIRAMCVEIGRVMNMKGNLPGGKNGNCSRASSAGISLFRSRLNGNCSRASSAEMPLLPSRQNGNCSSASSAGISLPPSRKSGKCGRASSAEISLLPNGKNGSCSRTSSVEISFLPRGWKERFLYHLIRGKRILLIYMLGRILYFLKKHLPAVYHRIVQEKL